MKKGWNHFALILIGGLYFENAFAQKANDITAQFSWNRRIPDGPPPSQVPGQGGSPTQGQAAPQAQAGLLQGSQTQQPAGAPPPAGGGNANLPPKSQQPPGGGAPPPAAGQGNATAQGKGSPKNNDPNSGYDGYSLTQTGDPNSSHYETNQTDTDKNNGGLNVTLPREPDVFLNASVHVGQISLEVLNITAKINLDAQVKGLLTFNAGVNLHVDRVRLLIQGVEARVLLEARLENLVKIISDVLDSLDLNPIIATLANDVNKLINTTVGQLTGPAPKMRQIQARSLRIEHNILYSVNDYTGNTHTNRILAQNGEIMDEFLDNQGQQHGTAVVGYYDKDMVWNGHNMTMSRNGEHVQEYEYIYDPFPGLTVVSAIYINRDGKVVGTQVISEAYGGGTTSVEAKEFKRRV
jgi:hypothetical protein